MEKLKSLFLKLNLKLFDMNPNKTTDAGMSAEIKTYYDKNVIRNAVPNLKHDQFGQKKPIPKGKGKSVEFRKYTSLPISLVPLAEGVTPNGKSLTVSTIDATIAQYGDYVTLTDMLILTAIDNNIVEATILLGDQSGITMDRITREIINAGTNVQYAEDKSARYLLAGGEVNEADNDYMSVDSIRFAVRNLKRNNAKPFKSGKFASIIHPDVACDLTGDDDWKDMALYAGSTQLFEGEIGMIHGVRFVESTESKIFHAEDLSVANRTLTEASVSGKVFTIDETLTSEEQTALVGRKIIVKGILYTVASATANTITVNETVVGTPVDGEKIYPGEAGAKGRDVYSTLVIGQNAYGVTELSGGGLQTIVKQLGEGDDPLNQRATVGWKATKTAIILTEEYMVRLETTSAYEV